MEKVTENKEKKKKVSEARLIAVKILNRYERSDSYVDKLLNYYLENTELISADRALLTEIVYGVIRWRQRLDWVLTGFFHGEFNKCLNLVKNAMRIALYQMLYMDKIPHHSAIDESVEIVKQIQQERAAGLVNGVLRNIARNLENIRYPNPQDDYYHYLSVMHSHPKWLAKRWLLHYGEEEAIKMMDANNVRPGIPLRINTIKSSTEEVIDIFDTKAVPYQKYQFPSTCIELKSPNTNVAHSELFKIGKITVQDPSAVMAVMLADVKPGMKVIDVCAAPGGKSCLMAELMKNEGKVFAFDKFHAKLKMIEENANRLGLTIIETAAKDAKKINTNETYDVVFADLPCSGLGNLAKKPEIKWKRELEDIQQLTIVQEEILNHVYKLVKIGGALIYSTCTIDKDENEEQVKKFLAAHPEFELEEADYYLPEEFCKDGFMQIFWHKHHIGGAFAARLIRKS